MATQSISYRLSAISQLRQHRLRRPPHAGSDGGERASLKSSTFAASIAYITISVGNFAPNWRPNASAALSDAS